MRFKDTLTKIQLEPIRKEDIELVRRWRNQEMPTGFLRPLSRPISKKEQFVWYIKLINNPLQKFFIISFENNQVGYCSISIDEQEGKEARPSLIIGEKEWRGTAVATIALVKLLRFGYFECEVDLMRSLVHKHNTAAISLYRAAGFRIIDSKEEDFFLTIATKDEFEKSLLQSSLL